MKRRFLSFPCDRPWLFALWHYAVAWLVLLFTQLVFYWVNKDLFALSAGEGWHILVGNLKFAASGTAIFFVPALLAMCVFVWFPRQGRGGRIFFRWLYGVAMGTMLAANVVDIPYYRWTFRRMTWDIFSYAGENFSGGWGALMLRFLRDFWPYFLLYFALLLFLLWLSGRAKAGDARRPPVPWWRNALTVLLALFFDVMLLRGGFVAQHKPLRIIDAGRFANGTNTALVVNTPFSIVRTKGHTNTLQRLDYFASEAELASVFSPIRQPSIAKASFQNHNVVLVILESVGEEYLFSGYTPFLDSLARQGTSLHGLANGKRSIESLPSLLSGIPSLMEEAFITSPYSQDRVRALPRMLADAGYSTAFYHGAYNGSMNFDSYVAGIGVQHYYGMNEYNAAGAKEGDYDGTWGIFDEPFLQYAARSLSQTPQPFFAALYTISSHHPYAIPPQYKGRFPKGPVPILETVGYADHALRRFFATASRMPWYANTLFVITADHAAQPVAPRYRTGMGQYAVPFVLYCPSARVAVPDTARPMQHADLLPTLVDLLGLHEASLSFGTSLFDTVPAFHVAYLGNGYQLVREGKVVRYDGAQFKSYDAQRDTLLSNPMPSDEKDIRFFRALLQQYNNRLLDNRLLPGK